MMRSSALRLAYPGLSGASRSFATGGLRGETDDGRKATPSSGEGEATLFCPGDELCSRKRQIHGHGPVSWCVSRGYEASRETER